MIVKIEVFVTNQSTQSIAEIIGHISERFTFDQYKITLMSEKGERPQEPPEDA